MRKISDSKVLIVGLVKDSASTIVQEILTISKAFKGFSKVSWLLVESDSKDNTVTELKKTSMRVENFNFITLGNLSDSLSKRTERIAHCRNWYLEEIRENSKYLDLDYVAVIDLDNMNDLLTDQAIQSCWDNSDWDVCTANQLGPYYDIWALRHPVWSPNDCWDQCRFLERFGISHEQAKQAAVYAKQIVIPPASSWIEVDSAFGGLAIYKRAALNQGNYSGIGEVGEEVCDHIFLHKIIRSNGGRIFINPGLINTDFTEHTQSSNKKPVLLYLKK